MAGTEANTRKALQEASSHCISSKAAAGLCPEGSTGTGPYPEETTNSRRWQRILANLAPWLLIAAGLLVLAWPLVSDWQYAHDAEQAITEVSSIYNAMSDAERLENLEQARAWNARLRGEGVAVELWDYDRQLSYKQAQASMMSYLEIPKLELRLPIYHGTSDAVLSAGVGHCDWSALPVGGSGNRCVLTAHSGMQNTRMFDDIRLLEPGDAFVLWTLGEPYAYRVRDSQVIEPHELESLAAEAGHDLATLVTCTPFGVNSHRLLVTGERCEYSPSTMASMDAIKPYVNRRTVPLLAGLAALLALQLLLAVRAILRRRRPPQAKSCSK